jgi:hypothetical protein
VGQPDGNNLYWSRGRKKAIRQTKKRWLKGVLLDYCHRTMCLGTLDEGGLIMSGTNRKFRRAKEKKLNKEMDENVELFGMLGDKCDACMKFYDKKDKEMVTTWSVVVRKKEKIVRLYCPACWNSAKKAIKEVKR